ncbi:hypothetical protein GGQ74_000710 [Desulfobaculum xiamenense]|uniref:Glycosyl transferases group 1 n=1 Tax=Desulfobaculum xiamenense TaxID=995050 RepID=A0A846QJ18_9BACT|nr:glycosyltransferase family 4 protein [Desulfobaculum xiamenense]NJB67070.1 hypothetical protein [Desulfobaculum xiamenense]
MRILMIAINDPAGTAIGFADALNRLTDHFCRVVTLETRYTHSWRKDLHVPDLDEAGLEELHGELTNADVFHFHMTADEHLRLGPFLPADHLHGKTLVHHHHGHPDFRGNPGKYRDKYARLGRENLLVSTPDLLRLLPEATWQPNLVPETAPLYTPLDERPCGPVRLAHSPTRRDLKNTDDLLDVLASMDGNGPRLELIDNAPHEECLRRKRRCHMQFDHMQGYYGMSSLEGLSQGLPTVAGLDDWCAAHMREFADTGDLPWVVARGREELTRTIRTLTADSDLRDAIGARSRDFMERHWSERKVVERLCGFYDTLR